MIQPMPQPDDPEEFIRNSPCGTVIYGFAEEEGDMYIDFLVREKNDVILELPKDPAVEIRAGAVLQDGVLVVAVMARFTKDGPVYETFWNYHRAEPNSPHGNIFEHMCDEPVLAFHFYDDEGKLADVIQVKNSMRPFFADILQQIPSLRPWTLQEFEDAKQAVTEVFPSINNLWEALGKQSKNAA